MRFGLWYDLRNPRRWAQPWERLYAETLDQIVRSEALGYDSIWVSEHHFTEDGYLPSGLLFLAAVAARTRRVRLGTLVLLLPLHHPLRVAEDAAVLDLISGGRVDLGVAAGYRAEELRAFGVARGERGERMEESLAILQSAWGPEDFSVEGKYFRLENINVTPKPLQQPFPLYMGGGSKAAMRRAARFGCHLLPPPSKDLIETYHQELEKHGRSPADYRIKCFQPMVCCEDPARGWEDVKEHYLYMHNHYRRWYRQAGDSNEPELGRAEDLPRDTYFVGTPEDCARAIDRLRQRIPFDEFIFWASPSGMSREKSDRSVELFAREVLPRFR